MVNSLYDVNNSGHVPNQGRSGIGAHENNKSEVANLAVQVAQSVGKKRAACGCASCGSAHRGRSEERDARMQRPWWRPLPPSADALWTELPSTGVQRPGPETEPTRQVPISLFANWDTFRPPTCVGPVNGTACLSPKLGRLFLRGRRVIASPEHTGNTYTVSRFAQAAVTPSPLSNDGTSPARINKVMADGVFQIRRSVASVVSF